MVRYRLIQALSLALALGAVAIPATNLVAASGPAVVAKAATRSVWLVQFEEPPLATFRGGDAKAYPKLRGLDATSPAVTGVARLDVESPASVAYRATLTSLREQRLEQASQRLGRALQPLFVYDVVNNGVALELTGAEAKVLARQPGIVRVEPDFVRKPVTDAGPGWIRADSMWNATGGGFRGEQRIVGVIDSGINGRHVSFAANSAGYTITNPRGSYLGLCSTNSTLGCNGKLIGIYDFTTGDGDQETNDGGDLSGHGTHVASTAVGNPLALSGGMSLSGVAPRANLIAYKVCEEESSCKGSWVLAALNRAVADRVDVINYSLGGDAVDPWLYQDGLAMLAAYEAGVVVVVAAGNDGPDPGSLGSPSNAPWVISVANTTHNRAEVAYMTLSGGPSPRPGGGVLIGASLTTTAYGPAPIVYAGDFGSALCATGPNVDALPPDTSTSPWNQPVFTGQIVICDRGTYARVIKGLNVKNAGGGGMVLVNSASEGVSVVSDAHELPATHLSYANGVALKQWLSQGSGHQAKIAASTTAYLASFADVLASSSGRGPIDGEWLKPNVAAPGTNILAAYKDGSGSSSSFAYMSGTSMATPHVTGAVALLRQSHPDWGPAEIMSALQGTARASVRMPDGVTPAGVFDGGAGVVDLSMANKPGLVFPVTGAQFRAANPSQGGTPRELNLGALVNRDCLVSCSFTRSVKNVSGSGTWQASVQMDQGELAVTPTSFTLANGATQTLQFVYTATPDGGYGQWAQGRVVLSRSGGGSADVQIPVAIRPTAGNLPDVIELPATGAVVASEAGWADVTLSGLVALPSAQFSGTDLVEPLTAKPSVAQDATADEVYDGLTAANEGTTIFRLTAVRSGRMRLRVEAQSQTATDIDLYVGRAGSATAMPSEDSEICASTSPVPDERCDLELDVAAGDHFWILLQNWKASSPGAKDAISLQAALLPLHASTAAPAQRSLIASGPGHVPMNASFPVRLAWNDPTMVPGESRWGHLLIGGADANPTGIGRVLVKLKRAQTVQHAAVALQPGVARNMRLAPGHAQDRLYIEVPPNATRLLVSSQGTGEVKIYLAYDSTPSWPTIDAAPERSAAAASSTKPGATETVSVTTPTLKPGRWYVTPVNTAGGMADFSLTVTLEYGSNRPQPGWGNWYNTGRSGSGFFFSPFAGGQVWTLAWYTFLQDGTPVWLGGTTPAPTAQQGSITFDLYRAAWDGERLHPVIIGTITLTLVDTRNMWVSWNADGESGSQLIQRIESQGCGVLTGTTQKPDGNWYTQARSGFGFEVLIFPGLETYIGYLYDGRGIARWVGAFREANPAIGPRVDMDAAVMRGACPLCTYVASTTQVVGSFWRSYSSGTRGHMGANVTFPAPMTGTWNSDEDVQLLTSPIACP